ncbi:hypothetical protein EIN_125920 [Entamoeba invadens IP1]|uniref:Core Histone H2A/H2B/H3 domain-containing protein n=1 Tax=Entamoeba invadens IP1 TaxID=370355 RepID=A0A0A1U8J0_ENTIV|nr:hypothetical protein EIN_125920 [Entamoeba invadens IP1]ELP89388.1 hypothetical protein EIN_125920 [Entamoeba invadens IP1]|eukprot:XP_004256159.1 hypothetical protein EIN_125920 [Entamoeba invadens IP1]
MGRTKGKNGKPVKKSETDATAPTPVDRPKNPPQPQDTSKELSQKQKQPLSLEKTRAEKKKKKQKKQKKSKNPKNKGKHEEELENELFTSSEEKSPMEEDVLTAKKDEVSDECVDDQNLVDASDEEDLCQFFTSNAMDCENIFDDDESKEDTPDTAKVAGDVDAGANATNEQNERESEDNEESEMEDVETAFDDSSESAIHDIANEFPKSELYKTDFVFDEQKFANLIYSMTKEMATGKKEDEFRIHKEAIQELQDGGEQFLVRIYQKAMLCAENAGRNYVTNGDMRTARLCEGTLFTDDYPKDMRQSKDVTYRNEKTF